MSYFRHINTTAIHIGVDMVGGMVEITDGVVAVIIKNRRLTVRKRDYELCKIVRIESLDPHQGYLDPALKVGEVCFAEEVNYSDIPELNWNILSRVEDDIALKVDTYLKKENLSFIGSVQYYE